MEALYERALARVPTPQLHEIYNGVLQEEFTSVSQSLDDVAAAYMKLEEVHEAVSKLQPSHDSSTGGRSDSLKASAEDTMLLQRLLQRQVERLAVGVQVAQQERKRKRVEEQEATQPEAHPVCFRNGNAAAMVSCKAENYKARRLEAADESDSSESSDEEVDRSARQSKSKTGVVVEREVAAASGPESSSSSESESDEDSDDVEGSEAAWKALITNRGGQSPQADSIPRPASDAEKFEEGARGTTKTLRKMATYMKPVVEIVNTFSPLNRSLIIPDVLAALKESVEEDVDGTQQSVVTASLQLVVSWGDRDKTYQAQHVDEYRDYAAAVESYVERLPSSARISELKGLQRALLTMLKSAGDRSVPKESHATAVQNAKNARKRKLFTRLIKESDTVPQEKRLKTLLRIFAAFRKETAADVDNYFAYAMIKVVSAVARWLSEDFRDPVHLLVHRILVGAFQKFSENRLPKIPVTERVVGLLKAMSEGIADPTSARIRDRLIKLRNRAKQVLSEVEKYEGNAISPGEAERLTEAARTLVEDVTVGWCPHQDVTMRKCVQELESILVAQTPKDKKWGESFEACIARIAKWKIKGVPAPVEVERKRKRVDADVVMVSSVATPAQGRGVDGVIRNATNKMPKSEESSDFFPVASGSSKSSSSFESESDGDGDESDEGEEEGGREAAWKTLTTADNRVGVKPSGALKTQSRAGGSSVLDIMADNSVSCMKAIVEETNNMSPLDRSFIIPDVLIALKESVEEDTDGLHPSEVASCLSALVGWWAGQCEDQVQHTQLYRECAAVMETYVDRLPMSTQTSKLKRLLDCLSSAIKNFGAISNRRSKRNQTTGIDNRALKNTAEFSNLVGKADTRPYSDRKRMLLRILVAFKQDTAADVDAGFGKQMLKATRRICRWLTVDPREPLQLRLYRMLVNALRQFSSQISEELPRARVIQLLENMSDVLADPSSSKTHKKLVNLRSRAAQVYQDVKRLQGKCVTRKDTYKLVDAVGLLAKDATIGWNPHRDATMRKCVKELKTILVRARSSSGAESRQYFNDCLGAIANWKIDDPPAIVKAPTK